jgi:hypothetical protein
MSLSGAQVSESPNQNVCSDPHDYLIGSLHRPSAHLPADSAFVLVRDCPPGDDCRAANCRNGSEYLRRRTRALVHLHLRIYWTRHARSFRPASAFGNSRSLSFRAESNVHRRRPRARRRGTILRLVAARCLCRYFLSRHSHLRRPVGRAHSNPDFRARVRSLPPTRQTLVAEHRKASMILAP